MKAFSLSRQGAPPGQSLRSGPQGRPNLASSDSSPGSSNPLTGGISSHNTPATPSGAMAGGLANLRIPQGMSRPSAPTFNSAPIPGGQSPRMMSPRPGMSGLAAKRGLKPGGMKLSDAAGPPTAAATAQKTDTGSQFNQFANIIDTQKGTLNFANKAVIHGGGIDFSSGTSFQISLDEVDTVDELGKGNYGTVYKVKHSRPKMRRPGMGLRGNMSRTSTSSSLDSVDSTASAPAATGTGLIMAMKEIRLELDNAKFAAIIMELDVLHRCVSPFIIDFYGAFFQEGAVYICMENMDGGSIDKLYGDGIPETVLRKITLSTVMGLKVLKDEHNIIHRDVKPTNILVNTKGQVKICDFGVSGNLVASIAKTNIGCQSYMAPERISGGGVAQAGANPGGGTYSVQSDIWSLGLTIIECAMGRYPYPPETYDNIFSQLNVSCYSYSFWYFSRLILQ
jgi:mitogen-activated protein kinase kinase